MKRNLTITAALVAATAALAGCTSPVKVAKDECQEFGFTPGTSEYRQCVQEEARATERQRQRGFKALQQWGQQQQRLQQQRQQNLNNSMTNCTTTYSGNTAYTNCY